MARITPSLVVEIIETAFPHLKEAGTQFIVQQNPRNIRSLAGIVDLVDKLPSELIVLDEASYANFVFNLAKLRTVVAAEPDPNTWISEAPNPVVVLHDSLARCLDEAPATETAGLEFVSDSKLRQALRLDVSTMTSAYGNGEWKAATVLGGSVVEALLFWALSALSEPDLQTAIHRAKDLPKKPPKALEEWVLAQYISVAEAAKRILEETAIAARLAKDFRNLIHPGRSQRLNQQCDRATALSTLAAVAHVVRDLEKFHTQGTL